MSITRSMPGFEGVAAGNTATLRLPIGLTFHQLLLTYAGVTLAQMDAIRVVANGEVIQRLGTGSELDERNQFEGRAAAAGVLVIDFDRYNMRTRAGQELTAIGTGVPDDPNRVTTLSLEVDINAAAVGSALSCKAVQTGAQRLGLVKKVRQFNFNAGGAGTFEISDLPRGEVYQRVFVGGHAARVYTTLEVERNNFTEFERSVAENEVVQTDGVRTPQADLAVIDFGEEGYGAEGLTTANVNDLRIKLGVTNAGAIPIALETMAPLQFPAG